MKQIYTRAMPIDTSATVQFKRSGWKLFGFVLIGLVSLAIGIWLIRGGAVDGRYGEFSIVLGWISAPLFALCTLIPMGGLLFGEREPVTISPNGLLDTRLSSSEIPWSAIAGLSQWKRKRTSLICLDMTPESLEAIQLNHFARVVSWLNRPFTPSGIYVQSNDLDVTFSKFGIS